MLKYTIPKEIKDKIPEKFYSIMLHELVKVFGEDILDPPFGHEDSYNLNPSTFGWECALSRTCDTLNMNWLFDYWDELDWHESDLFDDEIEEEIVRRLRDDSLL